jgi:hypothetical protein
MLDGIDFTDGEFQRPIGKNNPLHEGWFRLLASVTADSAWHFIVRIGQFHVRDNLSVAQF